MVGCISTSAATTDATDFFFFVWLFHCDIFHVQWTFFFLLFALSQPEVFLPFPLQSNSNLYPRLQDPIRTNTIHFPPLLHFNYLVKLTAASALLYYSFWTDTYFLFPILIKVLYPAPYLLCYAPMSCLVVLYPASTLCTALPHCHGSSCCIVFSNQII